MSVKPAVGQVGAEVAVPFLLAYLEEYNLPAIGEMSPAVKWWAAYVNGRAEAVLGLADLEECLFIYGLYANKGFAGHRAARALIELMDRLPNDRIVGYTLNANDKMHKVATKYGYVQEDNDGQAARLVRNGRK